jgi:hypothetical protein
MRGRLYLRTDYPEDLGSRGRTRFAVGPDTVPALAFPAGEPLFQQIEYYYHEAFHGFQRRAFADLPGEPSSEVGQPMVDPALTAVPEFRATGEVERRALAAAITVSDPDSLRSLVRSYLAVRAHRTALLQQVVAVEQMMERREGTAELVGCQAASIIEPRTSAVACVLSELSEDMDKWAQFPESDARLMRWRHYGTGAAIGILLDRLGVDGWRSAVQRGAAMDVLLAAAVEYEPVRDSALTAGALRRFRYDELLETARGAGGPAPPQ